MMISKVVYIIALSDFSCFRLAKARLQARNRHKPVVKKKRWSWIFYPAGSSLFSTLTFWTLTAVFSAVVIAYLKSSDWQLGWWT